MTAQYAKRKPAKRKPSSRRQENGRIAELLALLREASPPFGQTEERRMAWVERRNAVVNRE